MRAGIYARISADLQGKSLGVTRQIEDCTAKADALGWIVAETYTDNDLSASKKVARPQYQRLLNDLARGHIEALVVYDLDRLTRRPAELEEFIDFANDHNVALANVSGDVDLTNANGRMIARIKGAVAKQEAERISERTTRQKRQLAESGKPLGTRFRQLGYERDWSVRESEATLIREVFNRASTGESQNSITRDLVSRGVQTTAGKPWTALATSRMLKYHAYAGIKVFKGNVIGKTTFASIITEAQFEQVNNARRNGPVHVGTNTRKHLLSGFLVCDLCKNTMVGMTVTGTTVKRYRCDTRSGGCGRVSIKAQWIDDVIHAYMSQIVTFPQEQPDKVDYSAPQTAIEARIEALQVAMGNGSIEFSDGVQALKTARSELRKIVTKQAEQVEDDVFQAIDDYVDSDLSVKRGTISRRIKHLVVKPGTKSRVFDPDRLRVHMANGDVMPLQAIMVDDWRDTRGPV